MVERQGRSGRPNRLAETVGIFVIGLGVGSLCNAAIYSPQYATLKGEVETVKQWLSDSQKWINDLRIEINDLRALLEEYRRRFENPSQPQIEKPADRIL